MSLGSLSETMDLWSESNHTPYMAVTSHGIEGINIETIEGTKLILKLRSDLIGFQWVPGRHDGRHLATTFICITDHIGITDRVNMMLSKWIFVVFHSLTVRLDGSHLTMLPTMIHFCPLRTSSLAMKYQVYCCWTTYLVYLIDFVTILELLILKSYFLDVFLILSIWHVKLFWELSQNLNMERKMLQILFPICQHQQHLKMYWDMTLLLQHTPLSKV